MGLGSANIARQSRAVGDQSNAVAAHAAQLQADSATRALDENRRQYNQSREDQLPWLQSGQRALGRLDQAATGDMSQFFTSPDYNFRRTEGTRDIGNSFAARGGAASGNALRALSEFNSNLASGEFGNWWNRTASQAGVGQTAAGNLGALGANAANQAGSIGMNSAAGIGNTLMQGQNARASGIMGAANAQASGLNNTMNYLGYFMGRGGGGGGGGGSSSATGNWSGPR